MRYVTAGMQMFGQRGQLVPEAHEKQRTGGEVLLQALGMANA